MTPAELMSAYCVKVKDGSGVLTSAMSNRHSYVLTAGHVVEGENISVVDSMGRELKVIEIHLHPNEQHRKTYDCAIIEVEYVPNIVQFTWPATSLGARANLSLAGFPATERGGATPIKHYDGHLTSVVDELIVFTIDGIPDKQTISGMSGGGLYYLHKDRPYLVGVEFRMDGEATAQQHGRVQCQGLSRFNEIIEAKKIAPMVPCFLECFSRLIDSAFDYNVIDPQNTKNLQEQLREVTKMLIERGLPAPYELMEKYKNELLISASISSDIENKDLWEAFLEFIIISVLIDGVGRVDSAYLDSIARKRRILYSAEETNWIRNLDKILQAAKRMLDRDGTIIVTSPEGDPEMFPPDAMVGRIINNISIIPNTSSFLEIDNTEESIYKSFLLTHLKALRKQCVVRNEERYGKTDPGKAQLQLFRELYHDVIK